MTPEELAAIEARDAAIGSANHIRKQFGPTAAQAILDWRHLLAALREAEDDLRELTTEYAAGIERAEAENARLREAVNRADWMLGQAYGDTDDPRLREWRVSLAPTEPEDRR